MNNDFIQNRMTVALNCKTPYSDVFRNVYITKPSRIYGSVGSLQARLKWFRIILPKYYAQKYLTKQINMIHRLKNRA